MLHHVVVMLCTGWCQALGSARPLPVACYPIVLTYRCPYLPARLLVHGFLYKVTILKFPTHLVKTVCSYLHLKKLRKKNFG